MRAARYYYLCILVAEDEYVSFGLGYGGEDMPVAEERVGSDHGLGYYSGREVSIGHRVLLFAACECKKC